MKLTLLAGCALASVTLSGCGTLGGSGPSNLAPVIDALARAGCTGDLSFSGGATTAAGISPGSAHIENAFHGACDPRNAQPVAPAPAPSPPAPAVKPGA